MPLTKRQIAIKCWYEGRRKAGKPPRDKLVLDGKVKMTPRRREILYHVAFTDGIWWRAERDWNHRWENHVIFLPYLGETGCVSIVKYLRRHRLIAYSTEGGNPAIRNSGKPILLITQRGMDALLECVKP
jgi:hypothetical protein